MKRERWIIVILLLVTFIGVGTHTKFPQTLATQDLSALPCPPGASHITYTIQPGDTLSRIAVNHNVTVQMLQEINQIANPSLIYTGHSLNVPCQATGPMTATGLPDLQIPLAGGVGLVYDTGNEPQNLLYPVDKVVIYTDLDRFQDDIRHIPQLSGAEKIVLAVGRLESAGSYRLIYDATFLPSVNRESQLDGWYQYSANLFVNEVTTGLPDISSTSVDVLREDLLSIQQSSIFDGNSGPLADNLINLTDEIEDLAQSDYVRLLLVDDTGQLDQYTLVIFEASLISEPPAPGAWLRAYCNRFSPPSRRPWYCARAR